MMTIRQKLTLWFTCLVALIIGLGALFGWLGFRKTIYDLAVNDLKDKQNEIHLLLQTLAQEFPHKNPPTELQNNLSALKQLVRNEHTLFYDQIFFQISDAQQNILIKSDNLKQTSLPLPRQSDLKTISSIHVNTQAQNKPLPLLYSSSPVTLGASEGWSLQIGLSLLKARRLMLEVLIYEALVFIFSIVLALFLGQWLAKKAMQPMQNITQQVQQMTGQELFSELKTVDLPGDEIGSLAETFNALLQRISTVFRAEQRFVSDVSHEFNTPLTVIRGHAQMLQKRGFKHPEIIQKSTNTIIRESDHLTHMVDDLLFLSRLESRTEKKVTFNLNALIEELYEDLKPLYPQCTLKQKVPDLMIKGNASALRRLILNLLENAFKATALEDRVQLSISKQEGYAKIEVMDSGSGIAPEHLPHLFERFYRVDYARSRQQGGSGIGLALVSEIVSVHQGKITVTSELGKGTVFNVYLPLIKTSA